MLFDLQGRRKSAIKAVYLSLAILLGGGLVLFGVGSNVQGGLADLFTGGSTGSGEIKKQIKKDQEALAKDPKNGKLYVNLMADRLQLASDPDNLNAKQTAYKDSGKAQLRLLLKDWQKYRKVVKVPEKSALGYVVGAYVGLEDAKGATRTQRMLAGLEPKANNYLELMRLAIYAGDNRLVELSKIKALELAKPSQMIVVNRAIKELEKFAKEQSADIQRQIQEQFAQQNQSGGAISSPFGAAGTGGAPQGTPPGGK